MPEAVDTCSLATPASVCRTKHLHLRCSVDFTRRTLSGTAALTVQSQEDNLRSLVSVPKELVALMSAIRDGEAPDPEDPSRKIYRFRQKTESMLKIAEDLGGQYVWGQYDLLVLPPSFPYGGMENPCLTFVTPTLLAGDKSLSNVIAHEISHSWTGNLVTNKTWDHFWLNEGHTVYLERHICGRLFGEKFRHFHALGGWGELQNSIKTFGETSPFTKLVVDLSDTDPDVAYSSVPYEKGFALLFYLEQLLGGPEVFLGFLKAYVKEFSYKSITTDDWKDFLYSHFKDKAKDDDLSSFNVTDLKDLSSHQRSEFLAQVLQRAPLPLGHIKRMQEVYNFNAINNSEIRFRWLRLCIQSKWEEAIPLALKMATEQGRMKFTRPLFKDLAAFDKSHDQAVRTFQEHRARMHPVTAMLVGKDLKVD
ncbi:Leukotriene A-4 hydrolase [Tupaia chinensis]|uniref:Leukotriene A-4 hydrolase n=1 Tax=Tupaia chinensis TaxID=246437 RepID=L9KF77_TUPCH|nr:Leukotriene A-4 hydrolase [Tupaia chinensis]